MIICKAIKLYKKFSPDGRDGLKGDVDIKRLVNSDSVQLLAKYLLNNPIAR